MHLTTDPRIVVVGLGYVGLPLAVALAGHFDVTGLDVDAARVAELGEGVDRTNEVEPERLRRSPLKLTASSDAAKGADLYIVTVPTPVDGANRPDLSPLLGATRTVAGLLDPDRPATIVYESTVYPGVTEEVCGPLLAEVSGLVRGTHFFLGYSPERINPGDREHTIDRIMKVVAGENDAVSAQLEAVYGKATSGGTFRAASIKTAEAAKVIENAQRDINIAFMNEITQVFAKLGLSAHDVLEAAGTKWNFLKFHPGLVGGHCIGVDPYYLSHCAQSLGHLPRVILAGRAINDGMGMWIADTIHSRRESRIGSVLMLGLTFKPDVPDVRNSKVVDVVRRLDLARPRRDRARPARRPGGRAPRIWPRAGSGRARPPLRRRHRRRAAPPLPGAAGVRSRRPRPGWRSARRPARPVARARFPGDNGPLGALGGRA